MILQKQLNYIKTLGFFLILIGIMANIAFAYDLETQYARTKTLLIALETLNEQTATNLSGFEKAIEKIQTTVEKSPEDFTPQKTPSFSTSGISPSTGVPTPPPPPPGFSGISGNTPPPPPPPPGGIPPPPPFNSLPQTKTKVAFKKITQPKPTLPPKDPLTKSTYPNLIDFYYQNVFLNAKDYDFTALNISQNGNPIKKIKLYTETQRNAFLKAYNNRIKSFEAEQDKLKKIIFFIRDIVFNFTKNYLKNPNKKVEKIKEPFDYIDAQLHNLTQRQKNKLQTILDAINLPDGTHTFDDLIKETIKNKIAFLETLHANPKGSLAHTEHAILLDILYFFFQQDQDNTKQQALDYIAERTTNRKQTDADAIDAKNKRIDDLISTINKLVAQTGFHLTIEHEIAFASDGSARLYQIIEETKQKELTFAKSLKASLNEKFPVSAKAFEQMAEGNYMQYEIAVKKLTQFPKIQAYRTLIESLESLKKYTQEDPESSIAPTLAKSLKKTLIIIDVNTSDIPPINDYYKELDLDLFEDTVSDDALSQIEEMIAQQMQRNTNDIIKLESDVLDQILYNEKENPIFNTQNSEENSNLDNTFDPKEKYPKNTKTPPATNNVSDPKNNLKKTPITPSNQDRPNTQQAPNGDNSVLVELLEKQKNRAVSQLEAANEALQQKDNIISELEKQIQQLQQQNTLNQRQLAQSTQNDSEAIIADLRKQLQEALNRPRGGRSSGFSFGPISTYNPEAITQNNDSITEELKNKEAQIKSLENKIQALTIELNKVQAQKERVQIKDTSTAKTPTNDFFEEMEEDRIFLQNSQIDQEEHRKQIQELKEQLARSTKANKKLQKALELKEKQNATTIIKAPKKKNTQQNTTKKPVPKSVTTNKSPQQENKEKLTSSR